MHGLIDSISATIIPNTPSFRKLLFSNKIDGTFEEFGSYYDYSERVGDQNKIIPINSLLDDFYYKLEEISDSFSYEDSNTFDAEIAKILKVDDLSKTVYDTSLYEDVFESGCFKVNNLDDDGTYLLVLKSFKINVDIAIADKNNNLSNLCYDIYVYDENGDLFKHSDINAGTFNLGYIYGGKFKIKIYYQGLDITPTYINDQFITFSKNETYIIKLDFALQSTVLDIFYKDKDGETKSSNCNLSVIVKKLIEKEGISNKMTTSYKKEMDYYFIPKLLGYDVPGNNTYIWEDSIGNSGLRTTWAPFKERYDSIYNKCNLKELMPGIYKINVFYQSFNALNGEDGSYGIHNTATYESGPIRYRTFNNPNSVNNTTFGSINCMMGPFGPSYQNYRKSFIWVKFIII